MEKKHLELRMVNFYVLWVLASILFLLHWAFRTLLTITVVIREGGCEETDFLDVKHLWLNPVHMLLKITFYLIFEILPKTLNEAK